MLAITARHMLAVELAHGEGANEVPTWNWKMRILFTFHSEISFHQLKILSR